MGEKPYHDADVLEELYYEEGLNQQEIADKFDVAHQTISTWMNRHDINPGIEAGQFEAGPGVNFFTTKAGYEIIAAWNAETQQMEHVKHHRLLACLNASPGEIAERHVHHENGVKWDNRTGNLDVRNPTAHLSDHARERDTDNLLSPEEAREMAESRLRNEDGQFIPED